MVRPAPTRQSIINNGADVQADKEKHKREYKFLRLRIPKFMLTELDQIVLENPIAGRTAWILDAIQKKLNDHKKED